MVVEKTARENDRPPTGKIDGGPTQPEPGNTKMKCDGQHAYPLIIEAQRRGLHVNAYNTYPSIIRGGHTFSDDPHGTRAVTNFGDCIDLLIPPRTRSIGIC